MFQRLNSNIVVVLLFWLISMAFGKTKDDD